MRATWKGYITLGQVGIPVRLFSNATTNRPKFTTVHKTDLSPVERIPYCSHESIEIPSNEIIRAVQAPDGSYLPITEDDLDSIPGNLSKAIDIRQFCSQSDIDPAYYQKSFYIVPEDDGKRGYSLVREALMRTQKVAVVRFVMQGHEHLGIIRPFNGVLMLSQLRFAAETVPISELNLPALDKPTPAELDAGVKLIEQLTSPFFINDYRSEYDDQLNQLVERKQKGLSAPKKRSKAPHTDTNLIDDLRKSLESGNSTGQLEPPQNLS